MQYMNPAAIGESVTNAFWTGHDRVKQARTQNALAAFMQNPSMEGIAGVAQHDPMIAYQLRGMEEKRQAGLAEQRAKRQQVEIQRRAAGGDPEALAMLAGIDYNAWKGIKGEQREDVAKRADYIGNAALQISQLPENERPAEWDRAVAEGAKTWPDLAEMAGRYSEQAMNTAIRRAGMVKTLYDWTKPDYMEVKRDSTLVNVRDPEALRQFGQGGGGGLPRPTTPEERDALPPGTQYQAPDGSVWTVPGGTAGNGGGNFPGQGN